MLEKQFAFFVIGRIRHQDVWYFLLLSLSDGLYKDRNHLEYRKSRLESSLMSCRHRLSAYRCPDRQCHRSPLAVAHRIEMDVAFFTTYPATGYQRRSEAHKPSVGVTLVVPVLPPISALMPYKRRTRPPVPSLITARSITSIL